MLSPLSKALDITVDELLECKLHETSTDSQNDLIVENENNTTETKPTKSNKGKLIFKFILLIIIISFICFY